MSGGKSLWFRVYIHPLKDPMIEVYILVWLYWEAAGPLEMEPTISKSLEARPHPVLLLFYFLVIMWMVLCQLLGCLSTGPKTTGPTDYGLKLPKCDLKQPWIRLSPICVTVTGSWLRETVGERSVKQLLRKSEEDTVVWRSQQGTRMLCASPDSPVEHDKWEKIGHHSQGPQRILWLWQKDSVL